MKNKVVVFLLTCTFLPFHIPAFAQNVGLSILTPLGKLHVKGTADVSQLIIDGHTTQSNTSPLIKLRGFNGSDLLWIHSNHPSNVFFGLNSGRFTTGSSNTFTGSDAGRSNTTGSTNTAIGSRALYSNVTGSTNTANGYDALFSNVEGSTNTANGYYALRYNVAGSGATAIGYFAMANANDAVTPFTNNSVAVGYEALRGSGTPADNTGTSNTALGYQTLKNNTTGTGNTVSGFQSLNINSTGSYNAAFGYQALYVNVTGYNNTGIGGSALRSNVAGIGGTAVGFNAMKYVNNTTTPFSNHNVAVGNEALQGSTNADLNIGNHNTALGTRALTNNISGNDNTATGSLALYLNTTGNQNNAYGKNALFVNTSAGRNVAIGNLALSVQSFDPGSAWISGNVAVGYSALTSNQPTSITSGIYNTAVGYSALSTNIAGAKNTALGYNANVSSGDLTNSTAIGYNAKVASSNSIVLGGTGTDAVNVGIGTTTPNASAALDVSSTTKGFLPPRMTASQRDLIVSPAAGLSVWCSNCGVYGQIQVYNGVIWTNMMGGKPSGIPQVGDSDGGGIVAYILQSGDPGYVAGEIHGLIAAASDLSTGAAWGCNGTPIPGADGTALGTGNQNTIDIVNGCATPGIAARICNDLVLGGYNDWYLPSKDELNKLYLNRVAIGGFTGGDYWSSSEFDINNAWGQYFSNGSQYNYGSKNFTLYVRAVRAF